MDETPFWAATGAVALVIFVVVIVVGWRGARGRRRQSVDEKQAYLEGVHYLLSDNTDAAIEALTRVVEVNTETIETYFALGALFRRKGEIERAIRIHQNIILRPGLDEETRIEARFQLAKDYLKAGMHRQARETYLKLAQEEHRDKDRLAIVLADLRDLHGDAGQWEEAVEVQKRRMKVVSQDERSVLAHTLASLGRARTEADDLTGARAVLKDALKIDPTCVDAHLAAASVAARSEDTKTARKHFDAVLEHLPEAAGLAFGPLSDMFYAEGNYEGLGDYLREWVGRHPDVPQLRLVLARHLRTRGLTDRAVEELRIALRLDPKFNDARAELGRILLDENMSVELRQQFEELLDAITAEPGFRCGGCGYTLASLVWRCPRCEQWDTVRRRGAVPEEPESLPATG